MSIGGHFTRRKEEQAPLIGQEREGFWGMVFDDEDDTDEDEEEREGHEDAESYIRRS